VSWDALVSLADQRLYRAKQAGRNRICAADPPPAEYTRVVVEAGPEAANPS
jgi:hypothetical protein